MIHNCNIKCKYAAFCKLKKGPERERKKKENKKRKGGRVFVCGGALAPRPANPAASSHSLLLLPVVPSRI